MTTITITGSLHHADSRKMSKEEANIALKVFQFAQKAGRAYKVDLLNSDLYKKHIKFSDGTKLEKVKHIIGELRNAGEFINREGWKEGLTFGEACKNSRGGHNIKRDIEEVKRALHRKALLVAGGDALRRSTWASQTAYLNETEEGKTALKEAEKLITESK